LRSGKLPNDQHDRMEQDLILRRLQPSTRLNYLFYCRQFAAFFKRSPAVLLSFVKENFGVTMSYDMASNYKGTAIKQMGGKKRGRKPGPKPAVAAAAVATANGHAAGSISLEDITAVKALADRLGAEKVWQLAKVLAK
jgi:hypothetical protein